MDRMRLSHRTASMAADLALRAPAAPAPAQDATDEKPKAEKKKEAAKPIPPPTVSGTRNKGTFGCKTISYTATAGETYMKADDGTPRASIFSVSYVKEPRDPARPITFLFNGGPGSGSVWLHMGSFGPKRVAIPSDGTDDGAPPYPIVDNPESLDRKSTRLNSSH